MIEVENAGVFVWMLMIMALVTCGVVLLINLFFYRVSFANRVLSSVVASQLLMFVPVLLVPEMTVTGDWWILVMGVAILMLILGVVVSWPITHFAIRRFDRLHEDSASVFE